MKAKVAVILILLSGCRSLTYTEVVSTDVVSVEAVSKECDTTSALSEECILDGTLEVEATWHFDKNGRIGYEWYELRIDNYTDSDITILPEFSVDTVTNGKRAMLFHARSDSAIIVPSGERNVCEMSFKRNNKFRHKPSDREYILRLNYIAGNDTMTQHMETAIGRPTFWREGTYYMYQAYILQNGKITLTSDGADRLVFPPEDEYEDKVPKEPASFPGGTKAFEAFFEANVNRPTDKNERPIKAIVMLEFDVDTEGKLSNIAVKKDFMPGSHLHAAIVEEAIRLAKLMPQWIPATEWGVPVCSRGSQLLRF